MMLQNVLHTLQEIHRGLRSNGSTEMAALVAAVYHHGCSKLDMPPNPAVMADKATLRAALESALAALDAE